MPYHSTRRGFLATMAAAGISTAAGTQHVKAGCLAVTNDFDALIAKLKEVQPLGYAGFSTNLRPLQSQASRVDEIHPQLAALGLDLISVRASLPRFDEDTDRAMDDITRYAIAARQFGAPSLFLHSAGLAPDGKFAAEALDAKAKFLDAAGKRCNENGVFLAYRTQDAEFQNNAAELTGLMGKTNVHNVYFALDLARASKIYPDAIGFFHEHPGRTYAIEAPLSDFPVHELASAIHQVKWISWIIETAPADASRATMKKAFGM